MVRGLSDDLASRIDRIVGERMQVWNLPGVALGIVQGDALVWYKGYGRANLDRDVPPTADSLARIASVTKTFTTTAILQLRDEGTLSLDDALTTHIPEFGRAVGRAGQTEGVTLRRLLTHHSGLSTEPPTPSWDALSFPSMENILAHLSETEVVIPQDSAWKYSNLAFGLLGEVIHRVSGRSYVEYVRDEILEPLGLASTTFDLDDAQKRRLTGYNPARFEDRPALAPYAHLKGLTAAGQLHSTVSDLAKWVSFQFYRDGGFGGAGQVLSGASLAEVQRPQYVSPDWSFGQCLGWRAVRVGDHVYHQHGGGIHGFSTQVWFNVPKRVGLVQFVNLWPAQIDSEIAEEVMELLVEEVEEPVTEQVMPQMAPEQAKRLLGAYRAEPGIHVELCFRDGALRFVVPAGARGSLHAPAQLVPTDRDDAWLVVGGRGAGERVFFTFDEAGVALGYTLGGFVFRRLSTV